jgi:hypothetical protein
MRPSYRSVEAGPDRTGAGRESARKVRHWPRIEELEERRLLSISAVSQDVSFIHGVSSGLVVLATFTDSDPSPVADYTASIDWGDGGPTSNGTVSLSNGTFSVTASHTYEKPGYVPVRVLVQETNGSDHAPHRSLATIP